MVINVSVTIGETEMFGMTADQVAAAVLAALNGNPASDRCSASIVTPAARGSAGAPGEPPPAASTATEKTDLTHSL